MDLRLVLALEPVAVKQRQEQLEVLLLAAVRRRGHQQQVAGDVAEQLAELEALGLLQLAAEVVRAHAVRLVDDHQIPLGLRELGEEILVARQLIHPRDQQRVLLERRCAEHCLCRTAASGSRTRARTSDTARPATGRPGRRARRSGSA